MNLTTALREWIVENRNQREPGPEFAAWNAALWRFDDFARALPAHPSMAGKSLAKTQDVLNRLRAWEAFANGGPRPSVPAVVPREAASVINALLAAQSPVAGEAVREALAQAHEYAFCAETTDHDESHRRHFASMARGCIEKAQDALASQPASPEPRESALRGAAKAMHEALTSLIQESTGVVGLHLNGDVAPWDELLAGGRYEEWLLAYNDLGAALAASPESADELRERVRELRDSVERTADSFASEGREGATHAALHGVVEDIDTLLDATGGGKG